MTVAGVALWSDFETVTTDDMLRLFQTNTVGPLLVTQQLYKAGLLQKGSVVANLTSKVGAVDRLAWWCEHRCIANPLATPRAAHRCDEQHSSLQMGSLADNTSGGTYAYRASKAALNAGTTHVGPTTAVLRSATFCKCR